jgi:uncharacterized protein YgbK (DUF1537 family)
MPHCNVCMHDRREQIDRAILAGTSLRSVALTFGLDRSGVQRHGSNHVHAADVRAEVAKNRKQALVEFASQPPDVRRIESPEDAMENLQELHRQSWLLFLGAKARSDWKSAERIFAQVLAVGDRFGEMHKVFGAKGVTVNVDARQQKIVQLYDSLPAETLRRLSSGEIDIEAVLGEALDDVSA